MQRDPSWSLESVDRSQEDLSWSPHVRHKPPRYASAAAMSSISSLSSMSNLSMGSINNSGSNMMVNKRQNKPMNSRLNGDWPLPPLRTRPVSTATLEHARRISRSLSFVLGEPEGDSHMEEKSSMHKGASHTLPPLSPDMPPLLTRTVTSPHFSGQAQSGFLIWGSHHPDSLLKANIVFFINCVVDHYYFLSDCPNECSVTKHSLC